MRYGRSCDDGFLTVYSVDTEEEARTLISMACPMNYDGDHIAPELSSEQTLENLGAFGDRLARLHSLMKESE